MFAQKLKNAWKKIKVLRNRQIFKIMKKLNLLQVLNQSESVAALNVQRKENPDEQELRSRMNNWSR